MSRFEREKFLYGELLTGKISSIRFEYSNGHLLSFILNNKAGQRRLLLMKDKEGNNA